MLDIQALMKNNDRVINILTVCKVYPFENQNENNITLSASKHSNIQSYIHRQTLLQFYKMTSFNISTNKSMCNYFRKGSLITIKYVFVTYILVIDFITFYST